MVSVSDCVTSMIDGRVRLRHPALKHAGTADMMAAVIGAVEGVTEVRVNPVTGSMLLLYDPETLSREKLLELARQGAALLPEEKSRRKERPCIRTLLGRKATRVVDRTLVVALLCSLAGAVAGMGSVHRIAGTVFALASVQHMAVHRKALW